MERKEKERDGENGAHRVRERKKRDRRVRFESGWERVREAEKKNKALSVA